MRASLLAALLLATLPTAATATQSLSCSSRSYGVEMAVGSMGDVGGLTFWDKSGAIPDDPERRFDLSERHSKASIGKRSIDLEAAARSGVVIRVRITMKKGKGTIDVNGKVEPITCDWEDV